MRIVPGFDQVRHIANGVPLDNQGQGIVPQPDPVEIHDPFSIALPGDGNFSGNDAATAEAINLANASGLQSDRADKDQFMIDMSVANNCFDEESKGQIEYGPKNTGENYG